MNPLSKLLFSCFIATASLSTTLAAHAEQDFRAAASDFLIQDVCVDANGNIIAGTSPLAADGQCVSHRDLKAGETLPYVRHDWANDASRNSEPAGLERTDSFPVAAGNRVLIASEFDFGTPPRAFGRFDEGEGGQLAAVTEDQASVILTQDSKGLKFFFGPHCKEPATLRSLDDSWLLFDRSVFAARHGSAVSHLRQSLDPKSCPSRLDASATEWSMREMRFRRDLAHNLTAPLLTIVTDHFSGAKPEAAGSMERMYFTRELGWTRWERWQNLAVGSAHQSENRGRADRLAKSGRCDIRNGPPYASGSWVMVDCREWTNVQPAGANASKLTDFWISDLLRNTPVGNMIHQ
ncbi:hypothetical protein LJR034_003154 [Caballeronia sp. LjRoot34]|uniref:hypothetical protein n=1 Tax=Caballeronia sp. LjRoot34 TaxID=3342325 RepID=UPI003ECDFA9C